MIDTPREDPAGELEESTGSPQDESTPPQMEQAESLKRAPGDETIQGNGDRTPM